MKLKLDRMVGVLIFFICLIVNTGYSQTTGKIRGKVTAAGTGEPLPGVNVVLEGTDRGAATDTEGDFVILGVKPGKYTLVVRMIGYEAQRIEEVSVSVNRTAIVNIRLQETVLEGQEVVVTAERVAIKKDQTSSIKNVSSEQIQALPVETLSDVIEMQTGVVEGHFRGGRLTEVAYLVDGMQVKEAFKGEESTVELETEVVQDLEVITGTFNAEYGRAMSGIVNVVTKDGQDEFHGSISGHFSNFYTQNSDVFIGLKNTEVTRNQDYKVQLEGPIWKNHLSFFTNLRYQDEKGYLNGIRRFNVDDYTDFSQPTPAEVIPIPTPWDAYIAGSRYYSEHTGDNAIVPLNPTRTYSFLGKLTFKPAANLKLSLLHTLNYDERPFASGLTEEGVAQPTPELLEAHSYKYKPDGRAKHYKNTQMYLFQVQHLLSPVAFYDLKLSYTNYDYKRFLYEDPLDPRYVHRNYEQWGGGFRTGGQDYVHLERTLRDLNVKYDITWQVNKQHSLKTGFLYTHHRLHHEPIEVQSKHRGTPEAFKFTYDTTRQKIVFHPYDPEVLPDSAISMDIYTKEPYEFSCYLQDKMEFDAMVINLGVRYDYFNPNTHYPSQLRNPANQLTFYKKDETGKEILDPERMSRYLKAEPQVQISPRLGLSYTLGRVAVLHFSYGHFFQMPPLSALYTNHRFLIPPNDFATILGNPRIKAEKTVQYEMGVWQEIMPRMSLDLSVYYRDIYDLQSAIVVTTYNQIKYGLYSNKDYGNAKGFELKFDYMTGPLSFILNYTLQYTRGNADNPKSTFTRAGQSLDPVPRLIPLAWDQRHTLNASVAYNKKNYGVSLTGYYNSGLPYTFRPVSVSPLSKQTLYPNTAKRPSTFTVDLKGHYDVHLGGSQKIRLFLSIYNLLDRKNEIHVNSSTGRAYTAIIYPVDVAVFRSNYNDVYDAVRNPAMFSPPREIKFGIGYVF